MTTLINKIKGLPKIRKAILAFLILVPIVFLILPKDTFNGGQDMCLSKVFLGIECYACGLTRGIMHLIHLDFEAAANYNRLAFIIAPIIGLLWLKLIFKVIGVKWLKWL